MNKFRIKFIFCNFSDSQSSFNKDLEILDRVYQKPVQDALARDLLILQKKVLTMQAAKDAGLTVSSSTGNIAKMRKDLEKKEKRLHKVKKNAVRQKK